MIKQLYNIFIISGLIIFPLGSIHVIFVISPSLDELNNYSWETGLSVGIGVLLIFIGIALSMNDQIPKKQITKETNCEGKL